MVTLCAACAVGLIQPYKRKDNNTLAFAAQLMLLFVLTLANAMKLYKDIETRHETTSANVIMGFSDPFSFSAVVFSVNVLMAILAFSFVLMQARQFIFARRQQMRDAITGLTHFKYSFNLVSLKNFQEAGRLVTHEQMRDDGALTVFDLWEDALAFSRKNVIVFFSHQWLGWNEPDPNNAHYPVMIRAIETLQAKFGYKPEEIFIWLDYSSIPQKNKSSQLAAIDSIANYAALSKQFIVVAPETTHYNTGMPCDAKSYLGRGW